MKLGFSSARISIQASIIEHLFSFYFCGARDKIQGLVFATKNSNTEPHPQACENQATWTVQS